MELRSGRQEWPKGVKMKIIREYLPAVKFDKAENTTTSWYFHTYLDNDFHQVLLCYYVFAVDNLLEDARKNSLLVHIQIDAFELAQAD